MSLALSGVFEIRPDGSANNTGFFNPARGGTDYSQQSAAQVSVADAVTNGTTTVTSASAGFQATMLGNGINLVGDSWYEVVAVVSATQITVDRATANNGAGQSLTLGGATIYNQPQSKGVLLAGHKQWIRGTNAAGVTTAHTTFGGGTPALSTSASQTNPITTEGYSTTRGDGGVAQITYSGGLAISGGFQIVKNLQIQGVTGVTTTLNHTGSQCWVENIICIPGASSGDTFDAGGNNNVFRRITTQANGAAGGGSHAVVQSGANNRFEFCDLGQSGGQSGVNINSPCTFRGCLIRGSAQHGVRYNLAGTQSTFYNCIIWGNGGDGVEFTQSADGITGTPFENCIIGKNAGYNFNYTPADISGNPGAQQQMNAAFLCNWIYTTGTGSYHNLPVPSGDHVLTANPFVNDTAGNFTLNTTAGGGAAISAGTCPVNFSDGLNTANLLSGFYGTVTVGGGTDTATLISLWRELTNERNGTAVPDSVVCIYLDWGLQALNRASRYHYTTTTLTLVAGQQEYAAPSDMLDIRWIRFGLKELQKSDVERWRNDDLNWALEPAGEPREWAQYGLQIIFRPAPSAEAVAANPTVTLRYISNPPAILTSGPDQLSASAWRLAVVYGAFLWSAAYPDTILAQQRMQALKQEFEEGAQLFQAEMSGRRIGS